MLTIDRLAYQGRWRELNPLVKFSGYIILLITALCSQPVLQAVLAILIAPLTIYVVRVSVKRYLKWLLIPFSFLAVSLIGILLSFSWTGENMLADITVGQLHIGIDAGSLSIVNHTFWRSFSALIVTYLFVLTTPFNQLIIIGRRCKIPHVLMENALLTYRFIFIFLDEAAAIYQIQTLRFGYSSLKNSYSSLGMLITMLFERVITRYRQMTTALDIKLYNGNFHL